MLSERSIRATSDTVSNNRYVRDGFGSSTQLTNQRPKSDVDFRLGCQPGVGPCLAAAQPRARPPIGGGEAGRGVSHRISPRSLPYALVRHELPIYESMCSPSCTLDS